MESQLLAAAGSKQLSKNTAVWQGGRWWHLLKWFLSLHIFYALMPGKNRQYYIEAAQNIEMSDGKLSIDWWHSAIVLSRKAMVSTGRPAAKFWKQSASDICKV